MKAFASDFDGTLYFHREPYGMREGDLTAIRHFQDEGNAFGICTGRSLKGILLALPEAPEFDFYILASGALLLDRAYRPIQKHCMDLALTDEIYRQYRDNARIVIQANDTVYALSAPYHPMQTQIASLDELREADIYGFSFGFENQETAAKIAAELNARYAGQTAAFQNVTNVDIVPAHCSKGSGLCFVKTHFAAAVMGGIGDSYNDIPMLEAADRAFTFPFSPPEVQAKADHIVDSVADALANM